MSIAPGQMLSHHRLVEKIGEGGMGEVWKAIDTTLDREVALKILPDTFAADPARVSRFEREAKILASLDHPGIVTIHSVEQDGGVRFLTMELVRGKSLDTLIPSRGMKLAEFFRVANAVADALGAAHEHGVTHRDLKPANVVVGADGRAKVLDFGLAKLPPAGGEAAPEAPTVTATQAGRVLGTVPYMSPEQLRGKPVDHRTDIFSLGVMLYEMATGLRPFRGDSSPELMSSILSFSPPPAPEVRPDLPNHLGRIIRHCLEKDPTRRYQSALDVRNELADLERELTTETSITGAASAAARPRRGVGWLGAAGAVTLAAVVVLAVLAWSGRLGTRFGGAPGEPGIHSLAVLPLDNLMGDPEQDFFVEGMHEALITDLAKISSLRVISRSSVMRYRGGDRPIPEIAEELGVDAVVEGSVLRAGGQVRITAQLIDGRTDEHLWADNYDREVENTLALLSEVARTIATEIEIELTPRQEDLLAGAGPVDPEAQDAFLRGRHHFNRGEFSAFRPAMEQFRRAVEIEPTFAAAWSGIATCHLLFGFFSMEPADEAIPLAAEAANRALELDEANGPAHGVLGYIALFFDGEWETARRELEQAVELDPTSVMTYHAYADYLGVMGRLDESLEQVRMGWRNDPVGSWANMVLMGHLFMAERYDEVVELAPRALELFPQSTSIRSYVADALWQLGRYDESLEQYRLGWGADSEFVQDLERGFAEGGPEGALRARADRLVSRPDVSTRDALSIARYYAWAGDKDRAFEWLERVYEGRVPQLLHVPVDPRFDSIRSDPRHDDLFYRRIGLPR